jgi:dGTP triphosphohydrolase
MPQGVYTGFIAESGVCPQKGIIALLGYPAKKPKERNQIYQIHDLIYINMNGEMVLLNQKEVLDALTVHRDKPRYVTDGVDKGDEADITELVNAFKLWLEKQSSAEEIQEDGSTKKVMGKETKDILAKLKHGSKDAVQRMKQNLKVNDKFQSDNFDLITWFLVNN